MDTIDSLVEKLQTAYELQAVKKNAKEVE